MPTTPIDRSQLVRRHHVLVDAVDRNCVLCVGNGEFAFGADVTGLQTFADDWAVPLATLAQWAWHSEPNPQRHTLEDTLQPWAWGGPAAPDGRTVNLPTAGWPHQPTHAAAGWLERNPHKFNLARVGLHLRHADGRAAALADIQAVRQELQLWDGLLHSAFRFDGHAVQVQTCVHPQLDLLAITVRHPAALAGRIGVDLLPQAPLRPAGPAAAGAAPAYATAVDTVELRQAGQHQLVWRRTLDATVCDITLASATPLHCTVCPGGWTLQAGGAPAGLLALTIAFTPARAPEAAPDRTPDGDPAQALAPDAAAVQAAAQAHWRAFWQHGGAVDLSASADARAPELERRVVLSQYLMAVQAAGSLPPQETGLAELSWHGKFHLEMHWWHGAHFALWGRGPLLERSMGWYLRQLPQARQRARAQGLAGARWPKMVGPDGGESPGAINPLIVWQQPHPIHLAELLYRAALHDTLLQRYAELVFDTADALATMVQQGADGRFAIGPPVMPVQEIHAAAATVNPAFELAYFHFGLKTAQRWRRRLGLPPNALWDTVADGLAPLPQHGGLYLVAQSQPDLWQRADDRACRDCGQPLTLDDLLHNRCPNVDHPSFAGALGWLPGAMVDAETMRRTLHRVRDHWNLSKVWGWDFGMLAMTAARLGEPDLALHFLLHPSVANRWGRDGRVAWKAINAYLPANGALLAAVAMMAAGWDGAPADAPAPGFPRDGRWTVRHEGLQPLP